MKTNNKKVTKNIRYFNKIEIVDNEKNVIKSYIGTDLYYKDKFRDEIVWMVKFSNFFKDNVPKIDSYSIDEDNLFIKYEYIKNKTLHEYFINDLELNWNEVVEAYCDLIKKTSKIKPAFLIEEEWKWKIINFYLIRTIKNLKEVEKFNLSIFYKNKFVIINDKKYPSIRTIIKFLTKKVDDLKNNLLDKNDIFYKLANFNLKERIFLTHLDLIFGNIFYNDSTKKIKIFDPRGSFADSKEYGDIYYDLAKIYQSIYGMYDFIVEDDFEVEIINKNEINYKIKQPKNIEQIRKAFDLIFKNCELDVVKLIEAIQFFAMLPAHSDSVERQMIQIIIGISHFYEIFGDDIYNI